jgi:hypothetical protein
VFFGQPKFLLRRNSLQLAIPFVKNRGRRCGEAAASSVAAAFVGGRPFTPGRMALLLENKRNSTPLLFQFGVAFLRLGLRVRYPVRPAPFERAIQGELEPFYKARYDPKILTEGGPLDLENIQRQVPEILPHTVAVPERIGAKGLVEELHQGNVPYCMVDYRLLTGREGFAGHYVVLTGTSDEGFFYHDPGPLAACANREVSFADFDAAFNQCSQWFDHDLLLIDGLLPSDPAKESP